MPQVNCLQALQTFLLSGLRIALYDRLEQLNKDLSTTSRTWKNSLKDMKLFEEHVFWSMLILIIIFSSIFQVHSAIKKT